MDGLTIRTGQSLINTGKTTSELNSIQPQKSSELTKLDNKSFADTLKEAVTQVNDMQKTADTKMQQLATGKTTDIPDVMMSVEKADIALRLMVQVRNKVIEAYQDVMKMQV
jgi:flagellar hook-basal body complex protein FliE